MKILLIKTSALGDIVHTYPVLSYLRQKFPDARIDWLVENSCSTLAATHPDVSMTHRIDTKRWRKHLFSKDNWREFWALCRTLRAEKYDFVFDLQGNVKSGFFTAIAKAKEKIGFSRKNVSEWPNLLCTTKHVEIEKGRSIREDYFGLVQNYFGDSSPLVTPKVSLQLSPLETTQKEIWIERFAAISKPLVMVCCGSNWKNKQLPQHTLIDFLKAYQKKIGCSLIFSWGSANEKQEAEECIKELPNATLLEKVSLPLLQHLMNEMALVIAMDSLPLHLAATTKARTISFFGPSSAKKYAPPGSSHCAIQGICPYGRTFDKRCPILRTCPTGACMSHYSGDELLQQFRLRNP